MPVTHALLRGEITYEEAKQRETDILRHLTYPRAQRKFFEYIYGRRSLIEKRVAHHLGVPSSVCHAAQMVDWMHGSFNLCVPVTVGASKRVIIRFPLPYRVGDESCPGNGDEKLRCEAAAYAWITENCPGVPIPHLFGFSLSNGRCFTAVKHRSLLIRCVHYLRCRLRSLLGYHLPSDLIPHQSSLSNELGGYVLIQHIDNAQGQMLSDTWETGRGNEEHRKNLFRGLSKIMLELARVPIPRIGSFVIDKHGFICLENRPLTLEIADLENDAIPVDIPRQRMYHTADSYLSDLLSCHDKRLRFQPNAVHSGSDCVTQMSALAIMRTIRREFFDPKLNSGPFYARLTDINTNNILVDKDWNIKCLIDLEWMAVLPAEFMQPPSWLTGQAVDEIDTEEYNSRHSEFMSIFEEEEEEEEEGERQGEKEGKCIPHRRDNVNLASIMRLGWAVGTFWYVLALRSPTGLHSVFYDRIQPLFNKDHNDDVHFYTATYPYWTRNANQFVAEKIGQKEDYDRQLQAKFQVT